MYKKLGLKLALLAPTLSKLEGSEDWVARDGGMAEPGESKEWPTWKCLIAALQSPYLGQWLTS